MNRDDFTPEPSLINVNALCGTQPKTESFSVPGETGSHPRADSQVCVLLYL